MYTLRCKGKLLSLHQPVAMGIINVTPDSFYSGSRHASVSQVVDTAGRMLAEGAAILDIGGQSTRPGSQPVSAAQEADIVVPAIAAVSRHYPEATISVDTYYSTVATAAVAAGAAMVNDISAGTIDPQLIPAVASLGAPYVLMHLRGTPATMQQHTTYKNVTLEVLDFLIKKTGELRQAGVSDIIIDPGFGFAKTVGQNFTLLKNLAAFNMLQCPILLGISRKATIYKTLHITPQEALNGSTVLHTIGLQKGASILRVHDVKEAVQAIELVAELRKAQEAV